MTRLLICSGLFAQTFRNLRDFDRGFNPEGVLLVEIESPTWNRANETAEQGVQVSRMTVVPAGG